MASDPEARAASLGAPGAASPVLTAGYTGDGLRAWKQAQAVDDHPGGGHTSGFHPIATGLTYFLYDGDEPVCELNSAGAVTSVNTFRADGLVSRHGGSTSAFYAFDPSGSTAQRGSVLSSDLYDAFGQGQTTQGQTTAAPPTRSATAGSGDNTLNAETK